MVLYVLSVLGTGFPSASRLAVEVTGRAEPFGSEEASFLSSSRRASRSIDSKLRDKPVECFSRFPSAGRAITVLTVAMAVPRASRMSFCSSKVGSLPGPMTVVSGNFTGTVVPALAGRVCWFVLSESASMRRWVESFNEFRLSLRSTSSPATEPRRAGGRYFLGRMSLMTCGEI